MKTAIAVGAIAALLLLLFGPLVLFARGSTQVNHQNSLDAIIPDDNENIYMFGLPVDGAVFECARGEICTNVTFRPYNTDLLHTESILFCGNEAVSFEGKMGALVVTYRRQGSRIYGGVACHELQSVFEVKSPSPERF